MPIWSEFGDQINRLVYTLAGCKFQTNIASANQYIAERIFYSEVSVRMMRQGRFHPREEKALETLVEIGCYEAGLGRGWARRLLTSGQHSDPETVLNRIYATEHAFPSNPPRFVSDSVIPVFPNRLIGGLIGSVLAFLVWAYAISPAYPAPHELSLLRESLWGLLIGSGLSTGIFFADGITEKYDFLIIMENWALYLIPPAAGVTAAVIWKLIAVNFFPFPEASIIISTGLETFCFGAVYGLTLGLWMVFAGRGNAKIASSRHKVAFFLFCIVLSGCFSWVGFMLARIQPSFANQQGVDMFVGFLLRISLVILVSFIFPYRQKRQSESDLAARGLQNGNI